RAPDGSRLKSSEFHRRILQRLFSRKSKTSVVLVIRQRSPLRRLRGTPIPKQVPRSNEFRPTPSRVVGQPETVGTEDDVVSDDHLSFPRAPLRFRIRAPLRVAANRLAASRRRALLHKCVFIAPAHFGD